MSRPHRAWRPGREPDANHIFRNKVGDVLVALAFVLFALGLWKHVLGW
jgi:hypothetical protein